MPSNVISIAKITELCIEPIKRGLNNEGFKYNSNTVSSAYGWYMFHSNTGSMPENLDMKIKVQIIELPILADPISVICYVSDVSQIQNLWKLDIESMDDVERLIHNKEAILVRARVCHWYGKEVSFRNIFTTQPMIANEREVYTIGEGEKEFFILIPSDIVFSNMLTLEEYDINHLSKKLNAEEDDKILMSWVADIYSGILYDIYNYRYRYLKNGTNVVDEFKAMGFDFIEFTKNQQKLQKDQIELYQINKKTAENNLIISNFNVEQVKLLKRKAEEE